MSKSLKKLLLLDLDGTIRCPKSDSKFIQNPKDQKLIEGAAEAIARYCEDHLIIGITNQGGVAAGHKSLSDCIEEQRYTLFKLAPQMNAIFFCPDFEGKFCYEVRRRYVFPHHSERYQDLIGSFRKPGNGMIRAAIRHYIQNWGDLDNPVVFVGDRPEDELAAAPTLPCERKIKFIWAENWRNESNNPG